MSVPVRVDVYCEARRRKGGWGIFRRTSLSGSAFDRTQKGRSLRDPERFIESLLEIGKS